MLAEGLPKAVVFDLDGCLWSPDMYMLWGGGAPFSLRSDGDLDDSRGTRVHLLGDVSNNSARAARRPSLGGRGGRGRVEDRRA